MKTLPWIVVCAVALFWLFGDLSITEIDGSEEDAPIASTSFEGPTDTLLPDEVSARDTWAPPVSFEYWDADPTVAYRWVDDPDCPSYSGCWQMELVSRDGCGGGLYVAMNKLEGDTVVGYTNDSLPSLEPRQIARLTFTSTEDEQRLRGRVAEIVCSTG